MTRRARLVVILLLLVPDCLGNLLVGGSFCNTLSGQAWQNRERKWWGAAYRWIDWLFSCPAIGQAWHCKAQADREAEFGGVWRAWWAAWTNPRRFP